MEKPPSVAYVYLAFGNKDFHRQCCYSVYSLLKHCEGYYKVFILTDSVAFFESHLKDSDVTFIPLGNKELAEMRGAINFVNRIKIASIDLVIRLNAGTDVFVFLDTDTVITGDLSLLAYQLNHERSLFHCNEFDFNDINKLPISKLTARLYSEVSSGKISFLLRQQPQIMTEFFLARNTGVLGIHRFNHHLLAQVIDLTDAIYNKVKHHTAEQLAFSYILGKHTEVLTSDDIVFHYWNNVQKRIAKRTLQKIFNKKGFAGLSFENKEQYIAETTHSFLHSLQTFSNEYLEKSMTHFNNDQLAKGYTYAILAFISRPATASIFTIDILHHTKRILLKYL